MVLFSLGCVQPLHHIKQNHLHLSNHIDICILSHLGHKKNIGKDYLLDKDNYNINFLRQYPPNYMINKLWQPLPAEKRWTPGLQNQTQGSGLRQWFLSAASIKFIG